MAKKTGGKYHLYTRCLPGSEPKTWASREVEDDHGHVVGSETILVTKYGAMRGAHILDCASYKSLLVEVTRYANYIGMPKSRIWDIFDWNKD